MGYTYRLPGEREITLKDRISQIEVARFSDRAPDLWEEITDILLVRENWEGVNVDESGTENDQDKATEADEDKLRDERARGAIERQTRVSFELTGHSVEALQALIDFCVSVTESVSGFRDADGEPAVWKHMDDAQRKELYEMDITSGNMVTIYLDCWAHKNGLIDLNATTDTDD